MKKQLFFILIALLTASFPAFAHKVNLFCYVENDTVRGEGFFSQGSPVKNSIVQVYDLDTGTLVGETTTDGEGTFSMPLNGRKNTKVVLVASMGHRAEYLLTKTAAPAQTFIEETVANEPLELDYEKVAEIVQAEIQPLRDDIRRLEKQQNKPDVVAIVGGIGWIVGIFSLLYLLRRKNAS
jgi:nickel transport protein